jgi:hypothetical protein
VLQKLDIDHSIEDDWIEEPMLDTEMLEALGLRDVGSRHSNLFFENIFSNSFTVEFYIRYDGQARVLMASNKSALNELNGGLQPGMLDIGVQDHERVYDAGISRRMRHHKPGTFPVNMINRWNETVPFKSQYDQEPINFANVIGGQNVYAGRNFSNELGNYWFCDDLDRYLPDEYKTTTNASLAGQNTTTPAVAAPVSSCNVTNVTGQLVTNCTNYTDPLADYNKAVHWCTTYNNTVANDVKVFSYESGLHLEVDAWGRLRYQLKRHGADMDELSSSGWTERTLEVGRWHHVALRHIRDGAASSDEKPGYSRSQSEVDILVDLKSVKKFQLRPLYDMNVMSLFFCGWKFNNLRVWSKNTEVGDLGTCSNRHRTSQFAQNNLDRFSTLEIDVALEDAYDYTYGDL